LEHGITISGEDFVIGFNTATGTISSFVWQGTELLSSGPSPFFWRAPTDNDRGNEMPDRCAVWKAASSDWELEEATVLHPEPGRVVVRCSGALPAVSSSLDVTYTVLGSGEIVVEQNLEPGDRQLPELPRFGMQLSLPRGFETMTWYGRGPQESYWDRKTGASVGVYDGSVDTQFVDYSEPQENGAKTDVRWVALTNANGVGLLAIGAPLLEVTALHYATEDLERAKHSYELTHLDETVLTLDLHQTGVGGDDSWGARAHPEYTLVPRPYTYRFVLRGLSPDQRSPMDAYHQSRPASSIQDPNRQ